MIKINIKIYLIDGHGYANMLKIKIRKHKAHRFVSVNTNATNTKIFQTLARFSNFGVNSPEWMVGLLFGI